MRIALIRAGVVENVIEASEEFDAGEGFTHVPTEAAGPGWLYDGEAFSPPEPGPEPVPEEIERWRARAVLTIHGMIDLADETAASSGPVISTFWKDAPTLQRNSPTLIAFATGLGITPESLDQMFRDAARLTT